MKNKTLFISICLLLVLCSCGAGVMDLKKYVEDESNGLVQNVSFSDVAYKVTYRPTDLAYIYEMKGEGIHSDGLQKYREENKNTSLFILDITFLEETKAKISDFTLIKTFYQNTLNATEISLSDASTKSECMLYHCESTGKGKYRISILFEKKSDEINSDWKLVFNDINTGHTPEFVFKKEDIKNIPSLNL